jgi:hypothetical protein
MDFFVDDAHRREGGHFRYIWRGSDHYEIGLASTTVVTCTAHTMRQFDIKMTVGQKSTVLRRDVFDMLFVRIARNKVLERTILGFVLGRWESSVVDGTRDSARSCTFLHIEIE